MHLASVVIQRGFRLFIWALSDNSGQRHTVLSCPYLDCRGDQKLKPRTHGWSLHVSDLALDRVQKAQCIHDGRSFRKVLKFCTRFLALGFLALGRSAICVNLKLPKKPSLFMIWRGPGPKAQRMGWGLGASQVSNCLVSQNWPRGQIEMKRHTHLHRVNQDLKVYEHNIDNQCGPDSSAEEISSSIDRQS